MALSFSTVEIISNGGTKNVLKNAVDGELETTKLQIDFLSSLPSEIRKYFPEVIDYSIDNKIIWYTMPYYEYMSLDNILLNDNLDSKKVSSALCSILSMLIRDLYSVQSGEVDKAFIDYLYFERVERRVLYLLERRPDLKAIFESNTISINDKHYKNPMVLLNELKEYDAFYDLFSPPYKAIVHGDLEANHILINLENTSEYRLLDPRVYLDGGDPAYDLGKLWQSLHGLSHKLISGNFQLKINQNEHIPNIDLIIDKNIVNDVELKVIRETVTKHLSSEPISLLKNWEERTLFAEATHFLSAPPFFLDSQYSQLSEALFIQGTILLNDLYDRIINKLSGG